MLLEVVHSETLRSPCLLVTLFLNMIGIAVLIEIMLHSNLFLHKSVNVVLERLHAQMAEALQWQ